MPYTRYGPLITFYKICIINIIYNALEKSFEKMTILTKSVFFITKVLWLIVILLHMLHVHLYATVFFTHAMHLYAKMCHAFD